MSKTLILYSSTDGHTKKICARIENVLKEAGEEAQIQAIGERPDLQAFDKIVIGASIRYGYHRRDVFDFIQSNAQALNSKPGAFFSVNLVARKENKNTPETNSYARKFLKRINWKPTISAVFAGKVNYPVYRWYDRLLIQLIMLMTGGPTDPKTVIEYTDWDKVEAFARQLTEAQ